MAKEKRARLNVQALARRDRRLVGCIHASTDTDIISIDLAAGEPSVTTHFSQDKNYRWATFDGVGKAPFYDGRVLMIDDIYLMCMSVSPMGAGIIRKEFDTTNFADIWLSDPESIKSKLKKERQFHKILALGLGYGMGPRKMVNAAYDAGYLLSFSEAKEFHKAYWNLFHGVRVLSDKLAAQVERDGFIVNPFGYRGVPEPRKAFNFFIQSSVSGIMHVFLAILAAKAPYMHLLTVIHDELLVEVPKDLLETFRKDKEAATKELNAQLGWSVDIRTGFAVGATWYDAK